MAPKVTVVLAVYNGLKYLSQSVESVLNQDFKEFEFLILDDCSTDGSFLYLNSLKDNRIKLYKNDQNKGLFYNLNFLIKRSSTTVIKLWSQDDIMHPDCLSTFMKAHNQNPLIGFCYSGREIIDENGKVISSGKSDNTPQIISSNLHAKIAFFTGSIAGNIANVSIRKEALNNIGLFNEGMKISADFEMWVRLAEKYETCFIPSEVIQLRDHSGQLSRKSKWYIYHLKEDVQVYKYLLNYVSENLAKEGRNMLRKYKFVFYYTLMVKEFLNGRIRSGFRFLKELSAFDNFMILTYYFIIYKLKKPSPPNFSK